MATKKNFEENVDFTGKRVGDTISQAIGSGTTQADVTPDEKTKREATGKTRGKKGCESVRINMAFYTDEYDYIQTMAPFYKLTYTQLVNKLIREKMDSDAVYKEMRALRERALQDEERKRRE